MTFTNNTTNIGAPKVHSSFDINVSRFAKDSNVTVNADGTLDPRSHLQIILDCAKKVLGKGQVMIVAMLPHSIYWVTNTSQTELSSSVANLEMVSDALESRMSRENANKIGEYVLRTSEQNVLGIQSRNVTDIIASDRVCKASFDCYYEEPDFMTVVALLTPSSATDHALEYDQAQLSSMRYLVGVILNAHNEQGSHYSSNAASAAEIESHEHHEKYLRSLFPDGQQQPPVDFDENFHSTSTDKDLSTTAGDPTPNSGNQANPHMNDFIPSMSCKEIDYFYSMIPGTAMGTYSRHENQLQHSESVQEQEQKATDPDNLDPHQRMRYLQALSMSPILPRRPRDFAEVQAELELAQKRSAELASEKNIQNGKNAGIKCLECGADSSPEWRKGPEGPKTLCNRCGLRYAKKLRQQARN